VPELLEERLINLAAVPEAEAADFDAMPPGTWLLDRVPWTSAEHRIRAANADRETAATLGVQGGAACLIIDRRTWRLETPVTWVELTYPGDRQELYGRFTPAISAL
jgi:GntR family transcriptional regulator, histidine utilization repressor